MGKEKECSLAELKEVLKSVPEDTVVSVEIRANEVKKDGEKKSV